MTICYRKTYCEYLRRYETRLFRRNGLACTASQQESANGKNHNPLAHSNLSGGPEEDRTPDLRIANAALSQLSYRPADSDLYYQKFAKQVKQRGGIDMGCVCRSALDSMAETHAAKDETVALQALKWHDGALRIIDQTLLPGELRWIELRTRADVWEAIKVLRIRGAPAIGVCAAFGVLVGLKERAPKNLDAAVAAALETADYLATARPTAVNLFWALDHMRTAARDARNVGSVAVFERCLEDAARAICDGEIAACRAIGDHGAPLIREGCGVLTHCNAGGLATVEYGTALAPIYRAHEAGRRFHVFADETRPLLQGSRLTAWELMHGGVAVTVICDNMAAQVMREGKVDLVIVGADRIAANGDTANKIGTYGVAVLARAHSIPFYVAAPASTFDLSLRTGDAIPIEQRDPAEVTHFHGVVSAPEGVEAYNPAFDVTPAEYIAGFITEKGILHPPFDEALGGY